MNDNDDNQMTLSVGIFEPHGINEVNNNDIPEELNGIPFNRLGTRIQHMVSTNMLLQRFPTRVPSKTYMYM